jgi:hypothetical protein
MHILNLDQLSYIQSQVIKYEMIGKNLKCVFKHNNTWASIEKTEGGSSTQSRGKENPIYLYFTDSLKGINFNSLNIQLCHIISCHIILLNLKIFLKI